MKNISLIMDVSYNSISFDEEGHTDHLEIPGFVHGGGHDHDDHEGHDHDQEEFTVEDTTKAE